MQENEVYNQLTLFVGYDVVERPLESALKAHSDTATNMLRPAIEGRIRLQKMINFYNFSYGIFSTSDINSLFCPGKCLGQVLY